jgi:hypothetical protein
LLQNEACNLAKTGNRGDVPGVVQGCCVHCLVVSSIPLKKTLVFHISVMNTTYYIEMIDFQGEFPLTPVVMHHLWKTSTPSNKSV